jgi:hypothetical protein
MDEIILNTTLTIMAKVLLVVQASQFPFYNSNNAARKPCNRPRYDRPMVQSTAIPLFTTPGASKKNKGAANIPAAAPTGAA